jgi:hypothetical protein
MSNKDHLYIIQNRAFDFIIILSWVMYIVIALKISVNAPEYMNYLEFYLKIYIGLFLLYRFNPFRKIVFTELDRKVAFNSGIFIFTATALGSYLKTNIQNSQNYFIKNN